MNNNKITRVTGRRGGKKPAESQFSGMTSGQKNDAIKSIKMKKIHKAFIKALTDNQNNQF